MGRLAAFADRPHHQRLAATHITAGEHFFGRSLVGHHIGGHIAARIELDAQFVDNSLGHRCDKAHGQQNQIGFQSEFRAGYRLEIRVDTHTVQFPDVPVLTGKGDGVDREITLGPFLLRGGGAHFQRPVRPGQRLVLFFGRLRHDFDLGHRQGALTHRSPDAIGAGITAADHHHMLALSHNRLAGIHRLVRDAAVLLRQKIHGEMHAMQLAARHGQVTRLFRTTGQNHRIMAVFQVLQRGLLADFDIVMEHHTFGFHLADATVDQGLFHFEIGNAVTQQTACPAVLFINMDLMARPRQLLGSGQTGRTGADNRNALAGLVAGHFRNQPAFFPRPVDNRTFDRFDRDGRVGQVERARGLARSGADTTGKFGEVVGRMQVA